MRYGSTYVCNKSRARISALLVEIESWGEVRKGEKKHLLHVLNLFHKAVCFKYIFIVKAIKIKMSFLERRHDPSGSERDCF